MGGRRSGRCRHPHRHSVRGVVQMPFYCPQCSAHRSLEIIFKIELPPDNYSDDITLQVVECSRCGFSGIAVYEESRRGDSDTDLFNHIGYHVREDDLNELKQTIKQCPEPNNKRCKCPVHRQLSRKDAQGQWNALEDMRREGTFRLSD
jgi:hypothetical protein